MSFLTFKFQANIYIISAVLIYQWFIISMMFYGFYFALSELSGSFHLNSVLMGISEVFHFGWVRRDKSQLLFYL